MRPTTCTLALLLVAFPVISVSADPLAPPEAAALTTRLLDGRVWLVHAVIVRVIDGDTVVANLDLGWHTWRHDEHIRLNGIDAPERKDLARWTEAKDIRRAARPARDRGAPRVRKARKVRPGPRPYPSPRWSGRRSRVAQGGPGQAVCGREADTVTPPIWLDAAG